MHERPVAGGALEKTTGEEVTSSIPPGTDNDRSPLRQAIDAAIADANGSKLSMKIDKTALAVTRMVEESQRQGLLAREWSE